MHAGKSGATLAAWTTDRIAWFKDPDGNTLAVGSA